MLGASNGSGGRSTSWRKSAELSQPSSATGLSQNGYARVTEALPQREAVAASHPTEVRHAQAGNQRRIHRPSRAPATALAEPSATTVGATDDPTDPPTNCGRVHGTVWYRLAGAQPGRIVLRVNALDNLDAVVSVYRAVRSRLVPIGCAPTDDNGRGAVSFTSGGGDYVIMVGRERTSDDGRFRLTMFRQEPTSKAPGRALPRAGVASWVEPITDFDDAWSLRMKAGVEYRINLSPARGRCIALALFAPGTRSFAGASPLQLLPCGGYLTYTPGFGGSGRYSLLVPPRISAPAGSATT